MRLPRLARLSLPSLQSELFSRFALSVIACGVSLAIGLGLHHQRIKRSRRRWPQGVEVRPSRIRGAGEGLFASRTFEAGEELGEYYGQVLSLWQAMNLQNRDYLMGGFGLNAHVNAHFALNAAARYVNDNFDQTQLNSRFEKNKKTRRATLVATRRIRAGEEIYASYGETYWTARGIDPATGEPLLPAGAPAASDL